MTRRERFSRLFLAIVFVAGGLGAPIADAFLFHRAGSDPFAGVVHLEGVGGGHHAERCILAQPGIARRAAADVPSGLVRAATIHHARIAPKAERLAAPAPLPPHQSRAPPHAT